MKTGTKRVKRGMAEIQKGGVYEGCFHSSYGKGSHRPLP